MSADIAPSTKHILSCIPRKIVRKMVETCLPQVAVPWETFEEGKFSECVYAEMSKLPNDQASEFFDIIHRINTIARFRENGRYILSKLKEEGLEINLAQDLGITRELTAMLAWVYCNLPSFWAELYKRSVSLEIAAYRTTNYWYEKREGENDMSESDLFCFKSELKSLLKSSQPLEHVHVDADKGEQVTRYVIYIDPYPHKVPTFEKDDLRMKVGVEAEPFQIVDYLEDHKLTVKCKFRKDQTDKIIEFFLHYIIKAKRMDRPQSEYDVAKFNAASFNWDLSRDLDIIEVRNCGIKFVVNHPDGLIEEIGHVRNQGDILEYVNARYRAVDMCQETREILEFQLDVCYYVGKRPASFQSDMFRGEIDNRRTHTTRVVIRPTARVIKNCRGADRRKLETFLDHNGFHDLNEVKR